MLKNEKAMTEVETAEVETKKPKTAGASLQNEGKKIISTMSEEERKLIGSKSDTIQVVEVLALESKTDSIAASGSAPAIQVPKPVGFIIKATEDVVIPVIPAHLNESTGVTPEQIEYTTVKAGKEAQLTYIEAMFLAAKEEYAGAFSYRGEEGQTIKLTPKVGRFATNERALPTPSFQRPGTSIKLNTLVIDEKVTDASGKETVQVKKGFEKFAPLVVKATRVSAGRAGGTRRAKGASYTSTQAMAVALAGLFREKGLVK